MNLRHTAGIEKTLDMPFNVKSVSDTGTFSGYGSVFGVKDSYGDVVMEGAFERTLTEHKERDMLPALLWQHDRTRVLGVYTRMEEDDKGLYVEGELMIDDVLQARETHALMKRKALNGLSIGYTFYSGKGIEYDEELNVYKVLEIDLRECSIVTFPANSQARVDTVKSKVAAGMNPSRADVEHVLRAGLGWSRAKTKHLLKVGADAITMDDEEIAEIELLESIKATTRTLQQVRE